MDSQLLFASLNAGKIGEACRIAKKRGFSILSPHDLPDLGAPPEIEESADTYSGNAMLKARGFALWSGMDVVSDDTGLEIDALGGKPGVYSARFAGAGASIAANRDKVLELMKGEKNRKARFVCVLVHLLQNGSSREVRGVLEGAIASVPTGSGGFGYDSIFEVSGRTLAELKAEDPLFPTHRTRAFEELFGRP